MATSGLEITGLDEVCAKLARFPGKLMEKDVRGVLRDACLPMQQAARDKAPVYNGKSYNRAYKTGKRSPGRLAGSIKTKLKVYSMSVNAKVAAGDQLGYLKDKGHKTKLGMKLHRNVFSSFRKQRTKSGGKAFVEGSHYMESAMDVHAESTAALVTKGIDKLIDQCF